MYMTSCGSTPCNQFDSTNAKWFKIQQIGRKPDGTWAQGDISTCPLPLPSLLVPDLPSNPKWSARGQPSPSQKHSRQAIISSVSRLSHYTSPRPWATPSSTPPAPSCMSGAPRQAHRPLTSSSPSQVHTATLTPGYWTNHNSTLPWSIFSLDRRSRRLLVLRLSLVMVCEVLGIMDPRS